MTRKPRIVLIKLKFECTRIPVKSQSKGFFFLFFLLLRFTFKWKFVTVWSNKYMNKHVQKQ